MKGKEDKIERKREREREKDPGASKSKYKKLQVFSSWNIVDHPVVHEGEGKRETGGNGIFRSKQLT